MVLAAAHGQLGDLVAARSALKDLLAQQEDFAQSGRQLMGKWFEPQLVGHFMDRLRKAGLGVGAAVLGPGSSGGKEAPVSIAVLPFADMSPAKDQQYLCEGRTRPSRCSRARKTSAKPSLTTPGSPASIRSETTRGSTPSSRGSVADQRRVAGSEPGCAQGLGVEKVFSSPPGRAKLPFPGSALRGAEENQ